MKRSSRAMASALAGCMIVTALASPASAAGYSNVKLPQQGGADYSSSVVFVPKTEVNVVTGKLMEASVRSGKNITINSDDTKISRTAMDIIKDSKEPVVFVSKEYTVSIDPRSITSAKEINLGINVELMPDDGIINIVPVQTGDFGLEMMVTLPSVTLKEFKPESFKFFYVAKDGKRRELNNFTVNEDGSLSFKISHASFYIFEESAVDIDTAGGLNDSSILIG